MKFSRVWAMACADTFDVPCIGEFVRGYLACSMVSVDPYARNKRWATHTNDLNPETLAEYHMDAAEFLSKLADDGVVADLVILDPPYSAHQVVVTYNGIGKHEITVVKEQAERLLIPGGTVLSFGWNSTGIGRKYHMELIEILLVCHGGSHNDTICIAEKRNGSQGSML